MDSPPNGEWRLRKLARADFGAWMDEAIAADDDDEEEEEEEEEEEDSMGVFFLLNE